VRRWTCRPPNPPGWAGSASRQRGVSITERITARPTAMLRRSTRPPDKERRRRQRRTDTSTVDGNRRNHPMTRDSCPDSMCTGVASKYVPGEARNSTTARWDRSVRELHPVRALTTPTAAPTELAASHDDSNSSPRPIRHQRPAVRQGHHHRTPSPTARPTPSAIRRRLAGQDLARLRLDHAQRRSPSNPDGPSNPGSELLACMT